MWQEENDPARSQSCSEESVGITDLSSFLIGGMVFIVQTDLQENKNTDKLQSRIEQSCPIKITNHLKAL